MRIKTLEKKIRKIIPVLESISYKVVRKISQVLHEEFYSPEFMFRDEFIKEVKEVMKEVKKGNC